ncbi:hypothetical protein LN840_004672 [Escherichia coli]|nr:hypothetical protein [Escherichia coli]
MNKHSITFKKFAKGCAFIALCILTVAIQLYMRLNSSYKAVNITKQELEQYNDWFLSLYNPFIHFPLFFGVLSLIFYLLHSVSKKVKIN